MRLRLPALLAMVLTPALFPGPGASAGDLVFEDRVAAQTAIERVYYAHRIGENRRFEDAVPPPVIEAKVRGYLKLSVALEQHWKKPVTTAMLALEVERMESNSFLPDRLREIEAALGNDPVRIRECLARPILVERLVLEQVFYEQPPPKKDTWIAYDEWWLRSGSRLDEKQFVEPESRKFDENPTDGRPTDESPIDGKPAESPAARTPISAPTALRRDSWRLLSNGFLHPAIRSAHSAVWTGTHMIIWGGGELGRPVRTGGLYDPATDSWSHVSTIDAPAARSGHAAVWTGTQMVVWGGDEETRGGTATGGRYDPTLNTWQPISITRAPVGRQGATVVWTGNEMVVWGGRNPIRGFLNTGDRYDPAADRWTPVSNILAPSGRQRHSAVWTGRRMIVWGGIGADPNGGQKALNSGGSYDPARDSWSKISDRDGPGARVGHTAVWAGTRMIVWGGVGQDDPDALTLDSGRRYDPVEDAWSPTSLSRAPAGRTDAVGVWTGSQMVVWGGSAGAGGQRRNLNSGGRYDPVADAWYSTSGIDALSGRSPVSALSIGNMVLFWGGWTNDMYQLLSGAAYAPPPAGDPGPAAPSPGPPPGRPYQLPPDVLDYFRARYETIDSGRSVSTLEGTSDGPSGKLELAGRMMPRRSRGGATPGERALSTARAFLEEEAFFFDIPDQDELLATGVDWKSPGVASIVFIRRIGGLELQRNPIYVDVEADGPVIHVTAVQRPIPERLYAEVKRDFISEAKIIEIVRSDMSRGGRNEAFPVTLGSLYPETEPLAVIRQAAGYYGSRSSCHYKINAATGAIIKKDCNQGTGSSEPAPTGKPGG